MADLSAIREAHAPESYGYYSSAKQCPSSDVPSADCHTCVVLAELDRVRQDRAKWERRAGERFASANMLHAKWQDAEQAIEEVRALHRRDDTQAGWCETCGTSWPCSTATVLPPTESAPAVYEPKNEISDRWEQR